MHPVPVPFELLAPGLIFAAGGFYWTVRAALRQLTVDLNGIGRKMAELKETEAADYRRITMILLTFCPPSQREKIAEFLLEGK